MTSTLNTKKYCTIIFYIRESRATLEFFPVYLKMLLLFVDIPTGSRSQPCAQLEICKYQGHP